MLNQVKFRAMRYILICIIILTSSKVQSQNCVKDSIVNDFVNGKLVLINQLSIVNTNDAFFVKLLSLEFANCEVIDGEKGKELYGTMGENGVISISMLNTEELSGEYVDMVDASILKYFNEEDALFYHTNGIPNRDMYRALNDLINKKIERIDVIEKNEARSMWGEQAKNGAILITCKSIQTLNLFSE